MIVSKRMSKNWMRWGQMTGILVGLFCLVGQPADASIPIRTHPAQIQPVISNPTPIRFARRDELKAPQNGKASKLSPKEQERVQQWNQMPPQEKERFQERYQQLKKMSPQERKRYEKWHQQWEQLSPDEQHQIRQKLEHKEKLSPYELEMIRHLLKKTE